MSFFNLSDGTSASNTNGNAEMGGGDLPPIPDGTKVRAMVTEATWKDAGQYAPRHINLRWDVVDGEYKKRVVFQKVKVGESDATKRDKAIRMLAAIDANCGGKLMAIGSEPSDMDLMKNLTNKPMLIKLAVWEMEGDNGDKRTGNWVQAIEGKKPAATQAPAKQEPKGMTDEEADNEIGF